MTNTWYNPTGTPGTGTFAASAAMRSEFNEIGAAFDLLPTLSTGTASKAVVVNPSGSGLTTTAGALALAGNFATIGAFATTLIAGASVSLTLPVVSGTLATLAGTETLSNKTLVAPALGTPASGVATNLTGTAAGLTAGFALAVTTNANLTGPITSVGNATSIASQTGTGTKFVVDTSPTLVTPVLGVATATSINKVAITAPAGSATLAIANGKTLTVSNSLTLAGTDDTIMTFPSGTGTVLTADSTATLTNKTISGTANTLTVRLANDVTGNLPVANLNGGTAASASTFWRGDSSWAVPVIATMASGTSAAPGLPFTAAATTGFYRATNSGNGIGLASQGKGVGQIYFRGSPFENAWFILGTAADITATSEDTFVATIATPSVNVAGAQPRAIFFNMGTITLTATDAVTKVNQFAMLELDKTDVQAAAGPVTFNNFIGMRVRTPVPYDDVTIDQCAAIEIPYASTSGTGLINKLYGINFISPAGPNIGNYAGICFSAEPGGGAIVSGSAIPLNLWAGGNVEIVASKLSATPLTSTLTLNAANAGGSVVRLQSNSKDSLVIDESTDNFFRLGTLGGGNLPVLRSAGAGDTVPMGLSTKGVAGFDFYQEDQLRQIFSVQGAANAANRINVVAAASGAAPEIQAAGSTDLDLILRANGTGKVVAASTMSVASTTVRSGLNIGSGSAPTSPNGGDFWYDGTNLKFQDGGTTRTLAWI